MTATTRPMDAMKEVATALRSAASITAICHENPDADTIGAAIAVYLIAEKLGVPAEVVSADPVPPAFGFLPKVDQIRREPQLESDTVVVCDAATIARIGPIARQHAGLLRSARVINVDHHASSDSFGDLNLVDPHAAATCEILARLVGELGIDVDRDLATALLTGIVRDSQGFSGASTTGGTLRTAAALVDAGASLPELQRVLLDRLPIPALRLWGRIMTDVGASGDGGVVVATLTTEMLRDTQTQQHDADGLVEFLARTTQARITCLLREVGPIQTRVSIRTSDDIDATVIARLYDGGGHRSRAGFMVDQPVEAAKADLIRRCLDVVTP